MLSALSAWPVLRMTSKSGCPLSRGGPTHKSRAMQSLPYGRNCRYSSEHIKVVVEQGVLTLEGKVEWNYSRERAAQAVRRVRGVKSVRNLIVLEPKLPPTEIKRKIEEAFRRNAELDANRIEVQAEGSNVTLRGTVRSWAAREEAERVAWTAPGVARVDNQITVKP